MKTGGERRQRAEALALRARTLKEQLNKQEAEHQHSSNKNKIQQWNEMIAEWPASASAPLTAPAFQRRVNQLCAQGIPPKIRGAVWPLLIGNDLQVTREQFEQHREEVEHLRHSLSLLCGSQHSEQSASLAALAGAGAGGVGNDEGDDEREGRQPEADFSPPLPPPPPSSPPSSPPMGPGAGQTITSLLRYDLPRTFPTLQFFHGEGYMRASLERVLYTYSLRHPETGYVQGMSFVAAMLLLYMDEADVYVCLANLLVRRGPRDFLSLNRVHVDSYVQCFDHFFRECLPLLHAHLASEAVASEMFLLDWYLSVFAKALPLEVAARVWDCYLAEGELFGLKISLGILRLYAPRLCNLKTEQIMTFLMHLPADVDADKLIHSAAQIHVSLGSFERVKEQCGRGEGGGRPGGGSWCVMV